MSACIRAGIHGKVVLSQVTDVFQNLALENWILNHWNFTKSHCLLVYQNTPCVVIGRFQNCWREINVHLAAQAGVDIARRVSGGGTVYHDLGNVNFSFFSDKKSHCPPSNLAFISGVLNNQYGLNVHLNKRHDLYIEDKKISGSASRLIRNGAFHHCTLLVDSDLRALRDLLKGDTSIETSATSSLLSPTTSLREELSRSARVASDCARAATRDSGAYSHDSLISRRSSMFTSPDSIDTERTIIPRDVIKNVVESFLSLYDGTQPDQIGEWSGDQCCGNSVVIVNKVPEHLIGSGHETYDWVFGKSPKFNKIFSTGNGDHVTITVDKGYISAVSGYHDHDCLIGERYDATFISRKLNTDDFETRSETS